MKHLMILLIAANIFFIQTPAAYGQFYGPVSCFPNVTVYREGCPKEVLISSECIDCDPFDNRFFPERICGLNKKEIKDIIWGNRTERVHVPMNADARTGVKGVHIFNCPFDEGVLVCWPNFLPPVVSSTNWS